MTHSLLPLLLHSHALQLTCIEQLNITPLKMFEVHKTEPVACHTHPLTAALCNGQYVDASSAQCREEASSHTSSVAHAIPYCCYYAAGAYNINASDVAGPQLFEESVLDASLRVSTVHIYSCIYMYVQLCGVFQLN
jgi:hypothetical protein